MVSAFSVPKSTRGRLLIYIDEKYDKNPGPGSYKYTWFYHSPETSPKQVKPSDPKYRYFYCYSASEKTTVEILWALFPVLDHINQLNRWLPKYP